MVADYLGSPLTDVINTCIKNLYFSSAWKLARICAIPKGSQIKSEKDLRPISTLPVLSKVYERLIFRQLSVLIDKNNVLNKNISAYRKGQSTTTVLQAIRDDIVKAMKRSESTLAFNNDKTKVMILSTPQMSRVHHLDEYDPNIVKLERIKSCKLLGVHINEHLKWDDHIKHTITPIWFFFPLPQFLLRRLKRVQFAAASFVLSHYVKNFRDVLKIGWLSINERRDLNLLESCFKALHNTETWPYYLKIIKQECRKELRSSNSIRLVVPTENSTFQDNASKLFNNLPESIRNFKGYRPFLRLSRNFLCNRVQSD
ncbi:hypothetical protein pdam_00005500, partial [Pocillopora damicornis]